MKEDIRPMYLELQGYLDQLSKMGAGHAENAQMWESYHLVINKLNEITSKDYNDFRLKISNCPAGDWGGSYSYVELNVFRFQISGLISKLYGEYFFDERNPLSGSPSTIINASQNQSQSVELKMVIEMTELITNKMRDCREDSKERSFLEQIKEGLKSGKSIKELINLVLTTATSLGLALPDIIKLLSK